MRRRLRGAPASAIVGSGLLVVFLGMGALSLVWTPYAPDAIDVARRLAPPGTEGHLLGTDDLGRDVLTHILAGARNSLLVSLVSTVSAVVPGVVFGLLVAGSGPRLREVLTRATDLGVALPGILVALVLATAIGPGNLTAICAMIGWFVPLVARATIGPARQVLAQDFVEAAFSYGRTRAYVLAHHVLPNIAQLVIVLSSVLFATAILVEAALSYLGVGAQPPTPSWGRMLSEAQSTVDLAPTLALFPGLAIVVAVLGLNLLGDGLRTILDPKQQTRAVAV
jgi:peptide/nickel transport system permease protein